MRRLISLLLLLTLAACDDGAPADEPIYFDRPAWMQAPQDADVPDRDPYAWPVPPDRDAARPDPDAAWPDPDAARPDPDAARPLDAAINPDIGQAGLYDGLEALRDDALIDALNDLVTRNHRTPSRWDDSKYAIFADLDLRQDANGGFYAECIYTLQHFPLDGENLPNFNDFNIEHSWPKSLGAGTHPASGDIHHLFPTNSRVNSFRSSFHFGDTDCETSGGSCNWSDGGGSALGAPASSMNANVDRVFMVRQEYRGDIARAHFYFAVRYPAVNNNSNFPQWEEIVLRRWHEEDPVDDWERARNDGIEGYQGNRNPFVDHPEFVGRIADF